MDKLGPHDLIQSFITGLGDFLATLAPPAAKKLTMPILFESGAAAATLRWKADRDMILTGIMSSAGYNVTVSVSGRTSGPAGAGSGTISSGVIICTTSGTPYPIPPIRFPIMKDQTLTVWMGASGASVVVYLEEA